MTSFLKQSHVQRYIERVRKLLAADHVIISGFEKLYTLQSGLCRHSIQGSVIHVEID